MNIVFVGAECAPWSKTGGLGDVMGSLPKAMARRGHRVMVVVPRYDNYAEAFDTGVRQMYRVFNQDTEIGYFHLYKDGVDFVFVDHSSFQGRKGGDIYKGERLEQAFRNCLLCKAALEAVWHVPCGGVPYGDDNTVFIANDWHTAVLPVYLQVRPTLPPTSCAASCGCCPAAWRWAVPSAMGQQLCHHCCFSCLLDYRMCLLAFSGTPTRNSGPLMYVSGTLWQILVPFLRDTTACPCHILA